MTDFRSGDGSHTDVRLTVEFANAKPQRALSAASAISQIANDYSYLGRIPDHVATMLDAKTDHLPRSAAVQIRSWFEHYWDEIPERRATAALVERKRKEGFIDLTSPTKSLVGKKVVYVTSLGMSFNRDPIFGYATWSTWCSWNDEPVWVDKSPNWPAAGKGLVVVTGTLVERNDVPVFMLNPDEPFGPGLPVPPGYDAEDIRRRYVIVDAVGQVVESVCCPSPSRSLAHGSLIGNSWTAPL